MKRTDLPVEFRRLLGNMPYVTIATSDASAMPWNTPVVGYFDDNLNLYWSSDQLSQHSKNIAVNPNVFAVMYDTSLPLGEGVGLYLQMSAHEVNDPKEVAGAKAIYLDRFGEDGHEPFVGSCPRRIYKAEPLRVWFNTDGERSGHFVDARKELAIAHSK